MYIYGYCKLCIHVIVLFLLFYWLYMCYDVCCFSVRNTILSGWLTSSLYLIAYHEILTNDIAGKASPASDLNHVICVCSQYPAPLECI